MITVRCFGTLQLQVKTASLQIQARRVDELLIRISEQYPAVKLKDLKNSLIFVNGTSILDLHRLKTGLRAGDEVSILSPVGGG